MALPFLVVTLPAASARADDPEPFIRRFALRGEFGLGASLPDYQATALDYRLLVQGSGRLAFNIIDPLSVQASFTSWYTPNASGGGQQYSYELGLRFEPRIGRIGRGFVELNAGLGQSIELSRFTFDAAIGYEFDLTRWLALGPALRYGMLFATSADYPSDAQYLTLGASVTLRWPSAPAAHAEPAEPAPQPAPTPSDSDGDGVLDRDDLCPQSPAGAHPSATRRGCPEDDRDHDGVADAADQCPDTAAGDHPDPERAGCPDGDADHDGVLDHTDHCPDQPGAPDPNPTRNGCPGLVQIHGAQLQIREPVFFATNRDVILPRSQRVLDAVANALRAVPEIRRMSIEGHTDDVGDDAHNMDLSQRRANSVMAWLVAHGIDAGRLEAHGFGETRPLVQGTATSARAQNRRVEFRIVDPAQDAAAH